MTTQAKIHPDVAAQAHQLGMIASHYELWAAQPEMSYRDRADLTERAKRYRDLQFDMLGNALYCHADVIDQGPNISHKPPTVGPEIWKGVRNGLYVVAVTVILVGLAVIL